METGEGKKARQKKNITLREEEESHLRQGVKGVKTGEESRDKSSSVRQEVRKQDTADELDARKMRQRETQRGI